MTDAELSSLVPDLRAALNGLGADLLEKNTSDLSSTIRGLTKLTLSRLLKVQYDEKLLAPETVRYFVGDTANPDSAAAPVGSRALTVLFVKKPSGGSQQRTRLYVPVADTFSTNDTQDIQSLPVPGVIFAEKLTKRGDLTKVTGRILVSQSGSKLYPVPESGEYQPGEWVDDSSSTNASISDLAEVAEVFFTDKGWGYVLQSELGQDGTITYL